jgi:universal stress protein A
MRRIVRILVPVDYSTPSGFALETAFSLARSLQAAVEVLHVWSDIGRMQAGIDSRAINTVLADAKTQMQSFLDRLIAPEGVEVTSRVQTGVAHEVICALSAQYDLIVMGTHGRTGLSRLLLGSVAERVVQHAECPVLTVRDPTAFLGKRAKEQQIIHAMFEDRSHIERAFDELTDLGVSVEDISVVMTEDTHDRDFEVLDRTKAFKGMTAGGLMGGTIGGVLGGLVGVGSIVTGGIGLMVMGPALAFAAAGGLFGGLLGRSVPEDRAMVLKAELAEGKTLLAVHLKSPDKLVPVQEIVERCGGEPFLA